MFVTKTSDSYKIMHAVDVGPYIHTSNDSVKSIFSDLSTAPLIHVSNKIRPNKKIHNLVSVTQATLILYCQITNPTKL